MGAEVCGYRACGYRPKRIVRDRVIMQNLPKSILTLVAAAGMAVVIAALPGRTIAANGVTVKLAESPAPEEAAAEFRETLGPKAVQLSNDAGLLAEYWFCKEIPLSKKPGSASESLDSIAEITFVGIAKVHKDMKDFKNDEVIPGVYTMRIGIQPTDGNHLGTSPHPWFVILTPAHHDKTLDGITSHKQLAELSAEDTATDHPNILSLQPLPSGDETGEFPRAGKLSDEWKAIYLKLPGATQDGEKADLLFGMVYEGHGEI